MQIYLIDISKLMGLASIETMSVRGSVGGATLSSYVMKNVVNVCEEM